MFHRNRQIVQAAASLLIASLAAVVTAQTTVPSTQQSSTTEPEVDAMTKSMAHLRQIGLEVLNHAADNKGNLPASIDELKKLKGDETSRRKLLTNPRTGAYPGYEYVALKERRVHKNRNPSEVEIAYELEKDGTRARDSAILFLDGHVETPKRD